MAKPAFAILDLETSGLDPAKNAILEVGILLVDHQLAEIDHFDAVVADETAASHLNWLATLAAQAEANPELRHQEPWSGGRFVYEMHQKHGLADEILAQYRNNTGASLAQVESAACDFLRSHGITDGRKNGLPMTGSSILFDRRYVIAQMPQLDALFHYRSVDVSSLKCLVDAYRDDWACERAATLKPAGLHRSLADCRDTVGELAWYLSKMLAK